MKKLRDRVFGSFLDDGERIFYVAHRHILIMKLHSAKPLFFGVILPIFGYLLFPILLPVFILWALFGFVAILYVFYDWYYDVWLLTNIGVIDIERNGLFDITSTRIEYHMMEGISYNIKGVLPTIFNYGNITIDKLGAQTCVILKDAANPKKLERKVMEYQEKFVYERSVRDHHALKNMLSDMIAYHVQNKKVDVPNKKTS